MLTFHFSKENQPQNPEFQQNPENFHPCDYGIPLPYSFFFFLICLNSIKHISECVLLLIVECTQIFCLHFPMKIGLGQAELLQINVLALS